MDKSYRVDRVHAKYIPNGYNGLSGMMYNGNSKKLAQCVFDSALVNEYTKGVILSKWNGTTFVVIDSRGLNEPTTA